MQTSQSCFEEAKQHIVGGVNSPVRCFYAVGGNPIFFERAQGAYIYDVEGKRYIDYIGSWGPMILGHNHPAVIAEIHKAVDKALGFGAPTPIETELAKKIKMIMPAIDKVRFVNSGTEATMSAIRLARGHTGRDKIIKFTGCYHGHADHLLVNAGSGALTLGVPSSPGVPKSFSEHTLVADFNDLSSVEKLFSHYPDQIAAIILEPVAGNMNLIPSQPGFLEGLRELCDRHQSVLIFDEVMTGFRIALGGTTERYGVTADLYTLGKVIGGGMPVGAYGGKREIMEKLSPEGPVYQAGTLAGNPVAMAAGLATLNEISKPNFFAELEEKTQFFMATLQETALGHGIPFMTKSVGGMFGFFFTDSPTVSSYKEATQCDIARFKRFFHLMLEQGIYLAPSAYEAGFMSSAHSQNDIEETLRAADKAFGGLLA